MRRYARIKSRYSETIYIPRIGRIRLGRKGQQGEKAIVELPHFVVPPEVEVVYGPKPLKLDVLFVSDDDMEVSPQRFALYGSGTGLRCQGDNETALEKRGDGEWVERSCPCDRLKTTTNPKGHCDEQTSLMVMLPKVKGGAGGCYQITTRSEISTSSINSTLAYIRKMVGRIAFVPLTLRRDPVETHHGGFKQTHWPMTLKYEGSIDDARQLRSEGVALHCQIEGPDDEDSVLDPADTSHQIEASMYQGQREPLTPTSIAERVNGAEEPDQQEITPPEPSNGGPPHDEAGLRKEPAPSRTIEAQVVDFQALDVTGQATEIMLLLPKKLLMRERNGHSIKKAKEWAAPFRVSFFRDLLKRPDLQPVVTA